MPAGEPERTPGTTVVVLPAAAMSCWAPANPRRSKVLGHAGLATLAQTTADTAEKGGFKGRCRCCVDDSLFSGPALNPAWSPDDVAAGETAPLYPLALNSARFDPGDTTGPRPPGLRHRRWEAFAVRLKAAGAAAGTHGGARRRTSSDENRWWSQSSPSAEQYEN